jgi:hypothetical protein
MFLPGPTQLKKKSVFIFILIVFYLKKLEGDRLMTEQKLQFLLLRA